ncbi:MAG: helix-turn-helix domain-containing protein [Pirellulales bacterium]
MYTVKQVAERLNVSLGTIYGAIDDGRLKCYRLGRGGAIRVSDEYLREYLIGCESAREERTEPRRMFRHL